MHLYLKYNSNEVFQKVLLENLESYNLKYKTNGGCEIKIIGQPEEKTLNALIDSLKNYGIEIIEDSKSQLIQRIKDVLSNLVENPETHITKKVSEYLTDSIPYSYSYLSKIFSEFTHYSIEQFLILKKIEVAKRMIMEGYSLTEISYRLNYSSVAHLSKQFKKTTGLTPTTFHHLIKRRKPSLK